MQERPAVGDGRVFRVAAQAVGRFVFLAVFARIVALRVDRQTILNLVDKVVEGVVDVVEGCHLKGVGLFTSVGRS